MPETDVMAVSLETLGCYLGGLRSQRAVPVATSIPPAVIAPSRQHELQLDRSFPAYPVGTGENWPCNARVEDGYSRRMPVGLLWQFAKEDRIWKVAPDTSIDPIHALGIAARDSVTVGPENVVGLVIPDWLRQSQQQALLDTASSRGGNWHLVWRPVAAATQWLNCFPLVTGELAAVTSSGKSLGVALLERRISPSKILVSGSSAEINALTAGAAAQVERIRQSLPSYLTKLPLMRTVVSKMGLPVWISLLSDDDTYVPGGQKWSRPDPIGGIRIPGSKVLKLAVDHEDFEGVREASITLPGTITANQAAEIHVEITPAQGNARIELIPLPRVKTQKPIVANLKRMEEVVDKQNRTLTPNGYLDFYPRIAPPLLERLGSAAAWSSIANKLVLPLIRRALPQNWPTASIVSIKNELREKRNFASARNVTAIGSDGFVSTLTAELNQLVEGTFQLFKSRDSTRAENAKRLIAYTSTNSPVIQEYLVKNSKVSPERDEDFRMFGNCLRDATGLQNFFNVCVPAHLTGNHIRTIAELACYRSNAFEFVASEHLTAIYESIALEFSDRAKERNLLMHFRYLTLCMAFMLRRRIFDDSFVPPDSDLAALVKQTCLNVIQGYENGSIRVMGGSVDLPAVMRQLIKYVDREGQGAFVLAT